MLRPAVLLLTVLLCTGCLSPTDEEPSVSAVPPLRVLVAGDSLTEGYYASTPDRGFAQLVVDGLARGGDVTPVVVGVGGARAFRVAAGVEETTAGEDPFDVVVLEVGANDVGTSTLQEWGDGYTRLLRAVAATSPEAEVLCLGPWSGPRASRRFEAVLQALCRDHTYLPLSDLFATPGLRGPARTQTALGPSDAFHPNNRGHAAIAEAVLIVLS